MHWELKVINFVLPKIKKIKKKMKNKKKGFFWILFFECGSINFLKNKT